MSDRYRKVLYIWQQEMHGRMHPDYYQISILLAVDLCSSLAYSMMTHLLGKFYTWKLWLLGNYQQRDSYIGGPII